MAKKLSNQEKWQRNLRAARMIRACVDGLIAEGIADDDDVANEFSGIIAEWIFRNPVRHSGYISREAMDSWKTPTDDHYFGRKSSGVLVYRYARAGANTLLKAFDCRSLLKTKTQIASEYEAASIHLVKKIKTVYIIDGIEYDTLSDVARAWDITLPTVKNRIYNDKRGNYPTWKSEER